MSTWISVQRSVMISGYRQTFSVHLIGLQQAKIWLKIFNEISYYLDPFKHSAKCYGRHQIFTAAGTSFILFWCLLSVQLLNPVAPVNGVLLAPR